MKNWRCRKRGSAAEMEMVQISRFLFDSVQQRKSHSNLDEVSEHYIKNNY